MKAAFLHPPGEILEISLGHEPRLGRVGNPRLDGRIWDTEDDTAVVQYVGPGQRYRLSDGRIIQHFCVHSLGWDSVVEGYLYTIGWKTTQPYHDDIVRLNGRPY